ncbi:MAG: GerMN domain-containing protein [Spirochaetes bacterium]|nr:GerMN domain-containing protein [Spirochaetota bacterium]
MGKEKKSSFGIVFWIALLCFIAILYIGSRVQVPKWIADHLGGDYRKGSSLSPSPLPETTVKGPKSSSGDTATEVSEESPAIVKEEGTVLPQKTTPTSSIPSTTTVESLGGGAVKSATPPTHTRNSKLYFVRISESGKPELFPVERKISYRSAPLSETLKELLKGPLPTEKEGGISSLIPSGTEIKSVNIRDGIAYIDLSESFRFNPFGSEGYHTQVRQIVFTVTEFPGIQGVQFLVEGKKLDYLSPEGVYIGKPLSRESFNSRTR